MTYSPLLHRPTVMSHLDKDLASSVCWQGILRGGGEVRSRPEPGRGQQMDFRAVQSRNLDMEQVSCEGENRRCRPAPLLGATAYMKCILGTADPGLESERVCVVSLVRNCVMREDRAWSCSHP